MKLAKISAEKKTIYKAGLGTWIQWRYPVFVPLVITVFLGIIFIFYTFDPKNPDQVLFPGWMKIWGWFILFFLILDLLLVLQVLYFKKYKLVQKDKEYWLEFHRGKNVDKEFVIREFYYWWSYGWSVFGNAEKQEKDLEDWLTPSSKESATGAPYGRQSILFVGLVDPNGERLLLYQVLPPFGSVPDGWGFRKETRMKDGIKALGLERFVDAVQELKEKHS